MNWMRNITYDSTDLKNGINIDFQIYDCTVIILMDWIGLAHDRDRWRTLVSTVMNLRVP